MTEYPTDTWITEFDSSNVERFRWADDGDRRNRGTLTLAYWDKSNGELNTYAYKGVSRSDFETLCDEAANGGSVGRKNNKIIKGRHPCEQISSVELDERPQRITTA